MTLVVKSVEREAEVPAAVAAIDPEAEKSEEKTPELKIMNTENVIPASGIKSETEKSDENLPESKNMETVTEDVIPSSRIEPEAEKSDENLLELKIMNTENVIPASGIESETEQSDENLPESKNMETDSENVIPDSGIEPEPEKSDQNLPKLEIMNTESVILSSEIESEPEKSDQNLPELGNMNTESVILSPGIESESEKSDQNLAESKNMETDSENVIPSSEIESKSGKSLENLPESMENLAAGRSDVIPDVQNLETFSEEEHQLHRNAETSMPITDMDDMEAEVIDNVDDEDIAQSAAEAEENDVTSDDPLNVDEVFNFLKMDDNGLSFSEKVDDMGVKDSVLSVMESKEKVVQGPETRVYRRRWLMLAIFSLVSALNGFHWIQYSIVGHVICVYYNVSSDQVNWTSLIFMGVYPLLIVPGAWLMQKVVCKFFYSISLIDIETDILIHFLM